MAALELYGKCKELGHCDCGGFSVARHLGRWSIAKSATAATLPVIPTSPNIEGDDPIDDAPEPSKEMSSGARPVGRAPLPAWLKDKPGSQAIRPSTGRQIR